MINKKKLGFALAVIGLPVILLAQAIRWYNDAAIPQKVTLNGNEVFSLQQTGPNAYRWALASDVRSYMGGQAGNPVVNIYVTTVYANTNYITNSYITYLTVLSNAYFYSTQFVAYNITTNLTVYSNAYFYQTNFNNYEITTNLTVINETTIGRLVVNSNAYFYQTNFVTYEIVTNLTVIESLVVQSNVTVQQTLNVRNLNVTNLNVTSNIYYITATASNTPWAGPTNSLNFTLGAVQSYATLVPISVTNVTGQTNNWQNSTILCITNTSGSNIPCTVTASGWKTGRGDTMTCTNGGVIQFWFQNIGDMKTLATKEYP